MSTKPTDPGRFTVTALGVTTSNISAPSSSLRDTGFPNNYVPPAGEFNYLENIHYQWQQWLYDGNCAFAALSATSLTVSAATALSGSLSVTGATTLSNSITQTGGGATSLSGTLSVTGAATLLSTTAATGLITANAGVTAASNQHFTTQGTGKYKHTGVETLVIGGGEGQYISGTYTPESSTAATNITSAVVREYNIRIPAGRTIVAVRAIVRDNATGSTRISMDVGKATGSAGGYSSILPSANPIQSSGTLGATTQITASTFTQTPTVAAATGGVGTGAYYVLRFAGTANNACAVFEIEVDYTYT